MDGKPAARVGDPVAHTMALPGALRGLAVGALVGVVVGVAIVATGGLAVGVIAMGVGGALAMAGGGGLAGQYIGETIMGPSTGEITVGSPNIFINGRAAARATLSLASCAKECGVPQPEATGAAKVYFNSMPAGRTGEKLVCSAIVTEGSPNVFIGGPSVQTLDMNPEVPVWLSMTMNAMLWGGIVIGTGGIALESGLFAAAGSFFGGMGGSLLLSAGARQLGEALGLPETTIREMEVAGGFLGGLGGGYAGFKGGQLAGVRLIPNPSTPMQGFARGGLVGRQQVVDYIAAKAAGFKLPDGKTWWPKIFGGGTSKPVPTELPVGTALDRYGLETGTYLSPKGTPFEARSLPGAATGPPKVYIVTKPLPVEQSIIARWFDKPGGGIQYKLTPPEGWNVDVVGPFNVNAAKRMGFLKDE